MTIKIKEAECIGCGLCSAICPNNFILNDRAKAEVISQELSDCVREAQENCPTAAIVIE